MQRALIGTPQAKRGAERITKDAARKAQAAALKAKREAEKSAKAVARAAKNQIRRGSLWRKRRVRQPACRTHVQYGVTYYMNLREL